MKYRLIGVVLGLTLVILPYQLGWINIEVLNVIGIVSLALLVVAFLGLRYMNSPEKFKPKDNE